jgi:hypothetical protein
LANRPDRDFTRPVAIFIAYPALAALVGGVLLALGRWRHRRIASTVGVLWILYAAWETGMRQRWLCSGECNIRVDLLLVYPALLLGLVAAFVSLARSGRASPAGPISD